MIDNLTEAIRYFRQKARNIFLGETFDNYGKLAAWLTELQERREADRWISINEKLPDKNGNYLVLLDNGEITTDIFDEEELFMGFWGYMTHWRPLPKAPESEDK